MMAEYWSEDELEYYSYILEYMDNKLCIHHNPDDLLNIMNGYVLLKLSLVGNSNMYLDTKLKYRQLHDGIWAWSTSPSKYVKEAARFCEE